jgi:hypothetical protein
MGWYLKHFLTNEEAVEKVTMLLVGHHIFIQWKKMSI